MDAFALTAPYFYYGSVRKLKGEVAIIADSQLGADLGEEQLDDIVALLATLTGELPQVVHPTLPVRTAATPLPDQM